MSEERIVVLRMLSEGKISVEEAEKLLNALGEKPEKNESGDERGHQREPGERQGVWQREDGRDHGPDAEEGRCDVDGDGGALDARGEGRRDLGEEGGRRADESLHRTIRT